MENGEEKAVDTPCFDSGSALQWWLKPGRGFRNARRKLRDGVPITMIGSGVHSGPRAREFAEASTEKLLFFCYRRCFPALPDGSTTDARWGCLVRTTQMLCGTCLMRHHRNGAYVLPESGHVELKRRLSRLFMDLPTAPLGIHKVVGEAHLHGVAYASLLSPSAAGKAFAGVLRSCHTKGADVPFPICCENRDINEASVMAKLTTGVPVLLLIPVVLGLAPLSEAYEKVVLKLLDMNACCGVAGGIRKASLYMCGRQERNVLFLDPHYIKKAYTSEKRMGSLCSTCGVAEARRLDPSMLLGFYLHSPEDYHVLLLELTAINSMLDTHPLLTVNYLSRSLAEAWYGDTLS